MPRSNYPSYRFRRNDIYEDDIENARIDLNENVSSKYDDEIVDKIKVERVVVNTVEDGLGLIVEKLDMIAQLLERVSTIPGVGVPDSSPAMPDIPNVTGVFESYDRRSSSVDEVRSAVAAQMNTGIFGESIMPAYNQPTSYTQDNPQPNYATANLDLGTIVQAAPQQPYSTVQPTYTRPQYRQQPMPNPQISQMYSNQGMQPTADTGSSVGDDQIAALQAQRASEWMTLAQGTGIRVDDSWQ